MTPPAVLFSCWPLNPTQPSSVVPCRPLLPSEACSSSDKGRAGQTLSRAPQSCSMLTMHPPSRPHSLHLHVKTLGLISSSLELWHTGQVSVQARISVSKRGLERDLHECKQVITYAAKSIFKALLTTLYLFLFSSRETLSETQ